MLYFLTTKRMYKTDVQNGHILYFTTVKLPFLMLSSKKYKHELTPTVLSVTIIETPVVYQFDEKSIFSFTSA